MANYSSSSSAKQQRCVFPLWYERCLSLLILFNLGLVVFDMSYIPLRDFWLQGKVQFSVKVGPFEQKFPPDPLKVLPFNITPYYDWVKGIEPFRSTEEYLTRVDDLTNKINQNALATPALAEALINANRTAPQESIDTILQDLRDRSQEMIQTNPFQVANKTGTLERIKNRMRRRVFGTRKASATQAFNTFWTREYLLKHGATQELTFFNQQIRPLIETNYFRAIAENGLPIDNFPLLDFPFFLIFLSDFLIRTQFIHRRYEGVSWFDAMLWRWYDVFLLIPIFRWLRVIPLIIHLDQAQLIHLQKIRNQAAQGFVALIAEEMTEVLVIRLIDQVQSLIQNGQLRSLLSYQSKSYVDINNQNEIVEITRLVSQIVVEKVMPKIEPEVETFLLYNLEQILNQSEAYQHLQQLPGVKTLQTQITEQLITTTYQKLQEVLLLVLQHDPKFDDLLEKLVESILKNLNQEMKTQNHLEQVEKLLLDLLEEIKINYVLQLSQADIEQIIEETRTLRQLKPQSAVRK
ncbi:MAG: hypothetical protein VKK07_12940 [Merismopediaceae bacterium]|nr:hypothetical protein [Merismopediaceae bacterium]